MSTGGSGRGQYGERRRATTAIATRTTSTAGTARAGPVSVTEPPGRLAAQRATAIEGEEERVGQAAGEGRGPRRDRGGGGGDHPEQHRAAGQREAEQVGRQAGQGHGAEGEREGGNRGRLGAQGHAGGPADALGDPVRQRPGHGRAEPEHPGGGGHRELEPEGAGEPGVGQQQHHHGQAEGTAAARAAPGRDTEQDQAGHDTGPEHARLPAGDDDQQDHQHDPDDGQDPAAGTTHPGQPQPGGQDHGQVGPADRHQVGQPGRAEVALQLRREQRGVTKGHPDQQPGPFRRQGWRAPGSWRRSAPTR